MKSLLLTGLCFVVLGAAQQGGQNQTMMTTPMPNHAMHMQNHTMPNHGMHMHNHSGNHSGSHNGSMTHHHFVDHNVHHQVWFHYDGHSHKMAIVLHDDCYVFPLNHNDSMSTHSSQGLKALELKLMGMLATGTKTAVHTHDLPTGVAYSCRKTHHYFTVM